MTDLNEKALNASCEAYDKEWLATESHSKATAAAIRTYFEAATPPDVAGLVEKLEKRVASKGIRGIEERLMSDAATALRLSAGGGWRCPNTGHVYSASDLASLMERRDMFIVSRGLWGEFAATLDAFPTSPTVEDVRTWDTWERAQQEKERAQ